MNLQLILTIGVAASAGLAVLVVFFILRFIVERIARWRRPVETPLLAEKLAAHLEAVRDPRSVGEQMDRRFERMVSRSVLGLNMTEASAAMMLIGVIAAVATWFWLGQEIISTAAAIMAAAVLLIFFAFLHWRWRQLVQSQLPDAFHLLARSLRAGLTVDQAVELIGRKGNSRSPASSSVALSISSSA